MNKDVKKVTVYLNAQEHMELKVFSSRIGLSMSNFINIAIRDKIGKELQKRRENNE